MNNLSLTLVAALLGLSAFGAEPPIPDVAEKDSDRIQGLWKVVALQADGQQAPAEIVAAMKLFFKNAMLTFSPGEPGFTSYTYKLDPATKPASFDMIHADGKSEGEIQKGIYALEGDQLKLCIGTGARPKTFTAKAASGEAVYTLKRVKP